LLIIFFFGMSSEAEINIEVSANKALLSEEILNKINNEHFFKDAIPNDLNLKLGTALIETLDSQKIYFTKNEVSKFMKDFRSQSPRINITSSYKVINLYFNRLIAATEYQVKFIANKRFDFDLEETIIINEDLIEWQNSIFQLKKIWSKLAKNDVLTSILTDKSESEAIELISKRYKNRIRRISQRNEEDVFSIAMNTVAGLFDPHSSYFSPKSAEDFEMTMSLKLEGIGALLTTENDYPIIVSVVPGGPAEKSGKISTDDKIVAIKQLEEKEIEPVDVVGWRIDEVVQLIRGKAGTKLELEIIPAKTEDFSDRKWVILTREEVKLEEQAVKSLVINLPYENQSLKIGIIDLPAFYIDFSAWRARDPNFRSSSKDVEEILERFNEENVDGVIVDLRGNSGGSLYEANKLTGLFVSAGPTLQVKESNGMIMSWGDARAKQIWKKPMAVMVDRYSASASEIFAGAIQDYERGLIIGHPTFGKGTVQQLDDLTSGQLKLTESKFYRITGSGMQSKGVTPDIILPATWDIQKSGESSLDSALLWDKIKAVRFKKFYFNQNAVTHVRKAHLDRLDNSPDLNYLLDIRERYDRQQDKEALSINLDIRKSEKLNRQQWALDIENKRRDAHGFKRFKTYQDLKDFNENKEDIDIDIQNDYLLNEGAMILSDYIYYLNRNLLLSEAA
jgi:carboxyl-terminal processing protease